MKLIQYKPLIGLFALLILYLTGCKKEENESMVPSIMEFSISAIPGSIQSDLKSISTNSIDRATAIIITIVTSAGDTTKFNSSTIRLYKMGDALISEKLLLVPGNYQIIKFLVADSTGSIIFALPMEGSALATAVKSPLPIDFNVEKDKSSLISVQVISTEEENIQKFGLTWFQIQNIEPIIVQGAICDLLTGQPIKAKVVVTADTPQPFSAVYEILPSVNNNLILPEFYTGFTFEISSTGYYSREIYLSTDSLKNLIGLSGNLPLLVGLEKRVVVIDVDGNEYRTVKIGSQIWMGENLRVTHFNDYTPIHHAYIHHEYSGNWSEWDPTRLMKPAYSFPIKNNQEVVNLGALYNYEVVETNKICPCGWHVPSVEEWNILINYLGGPSIAGERLKGGKWCGTYSIDKAKFTALLVGMVYGGDFETSITSFWSNNINMPFNIYCGSYIISNAVINRAAGRSIRCIEDN